MQIQTAVGPLCLDPHVSVGLRRGDEADKVRAFKAALGLTDEDAAPTHIDVGRRIMRSRFEASTRAGNSDSFRALQKLIYVSDLVFGVQKVRTARLHASCASCSRLPCWAASWAQVRAIHLQSSRAAIMRSVRSALQTMLEKIVQDLCCGCAWWQRKPQ